MREKRKKKKMLKKKHMKKNSRVGTQFGTTPSFIVLSRLGGCLRLLGL